MSERPTAAQVRAELRRRGEAGEARITRSLGEPSLVAIALGAACSSLFYILGVVADGALGLTPLAFAVAGVFFVVTLQTYIEASSLHIERGGASMFARHAFDELWSFVAGWAILLDYLIVMALGAFAVPTYLTAFWNGADNSGLELPITGAVLALVAWENFRGPTAARYRLILRLALLSLLLFAALSAIAFAESFDIGAITGSIDLGTAPEYEELLFAMVLAGVAVTGIEAASGLAGEVRVGRRALRRTSAVAGLGVVALFSILSLAALMTVPVIDGETALGGAFIEAPLLGMAGALEPPWLAEAARYAVGGIGAAVLTAAVSGQLLGIGRLTYSLGTHRQIPSLLSRLHTTYGTPYVVIVLACLIAFALALSGDVEFLAGLFAFGATLTFTIAHVAVITLRYREPERDRPYRVPFSVAVGGGSLPLPAVAGALMSAAAWVSVVLLHEGARYVGGAWMVFGLLLYVIYRKRGGKPLRKRFEIPEQALRESAGTEYGSILVPVFGNALDDDIVGTAGRLAAEEIEPGEGGPVLEALYVFEIPMSLPIDARISDERVQAARRILARAKEVGEEYEGVEVATATTRGRNAGSAIVEEARRRGVEAIVLAAGSPTKIQGGRRLGGRGGLGRERYADETTGYVLEKAPCRVILTAPPTEAAAADPGA